MSNFDPYHKWLGIPPAEQPPHHYRLLSIAPFESDLDVIEAAADRQMSYIRQCATGPYTKESQQILNELSAARVCLLNAAKKKTYDAELKARLAPAPPPPPATAVSRPRVTRIPAQRQPETDGADDDEFPMVVLERAVGRGSLSLPPRRRRSRRKAQPNLLWLCGGAGAVGLLLLGGLIHLVTRSGDETKAPVASAPAAANQGEQAKPPAFERSSAKGNPPPSNAGGKEAGSPAVAEGLSPAELPRAIVERILALKGDIAVMVGESRAWTFIRKIDEFPAEEFKIALIGLKTGSVDDLKLLAALPIDQLQLMGKDFTDEHLSVLSGAKSIQMLRIDNSSCTDAGLKHLGSCPGLKMLHLFGGGFTPAGFRHLAQISGLFQLMVGGRNFTDEHVEALAGLAGLQHVSLHDCSVTGAGFRTFGGTSKVTSLTFVTCPLDAAGIETVGKMLPYLLQLFISSTPMNDAMLRGLKKMQRLQSLQLVMCNVTDARLPLIAELTGLSGLTLHGEPLNGTGFRETAGKLPNLKVCNLFNSRLNDEGLKQLLAAAPRLENLMIINTGVTDEGLKKLKDARALQHLMLSKNRFSPETLDELRAALPKCMINLQ